MARRLFRRPSRWYLLLAAALSVATAMLFRSYTDRIARAHAEAVEPVQVVVAERYVSRGDAVGADDVVLRTMPRRFRPPGSYSKVSQVSGRVALADLAPGEAVTTTRLARVRAGPVASLVPEGLRAFAVPTSLPAGAVEPGDSVDVLATYGSGQPHTETVVEEVEVLFVLPGGGTGPGGSALDLDAEAAGVGDSITLIVLVSTEQQERLAFARAFADLAVSIAPAAG